ncbi:MAG: exonuclease SbcCD subunit D [Selenomonadaceae bacterium]|nr:exonuclease SbcCD subunit D [Selenomonadaceae bacterium]
MRLLHTADWHLGKTLKGANLLDDQKFIIDEIFSIIDKEKIDALLISGDVYDRAVPPIEAVNLFDETLNRLAERNLPTLIIAGNHDSATRLNFGSKIFASKNIFIAAKTPAHIKLKDDFGEIFFSLIPFAEPDEIVAAINSAREKIPDGKRSVVLAHAFLAGGVESESERKFVGTAANVDAQIFSAYDYVALGHLHRPQKISVENIRYAGSPLKYHFGEADHKKSVTVVDIGAEGFISAEEKFLKPLHDVIVVENKFSELVKLPKCEDYAQIILTDDAYIFNTENLRDAFPNFLEVKRKSHMQSYDDEPTKNFRKEDPIAEQFAKFFESVTKEPLTDEERTTFEEFLREFERDEREATK